MGARFFNFRKPLRYETLLSWLIRVSNANNYRSVERILRLLERKLGIDKLSIQDIENNVSDQIIALLAQLAGLSSDELTCLYLSFYFDTLYTLPSLPANTGFPASTNFTLYEALVRPVPRICVACLRLKRFIRYFWHLDFYLQCDEHDVWMSDICMFCGGRWEVVDVIRDTCPHCGEKYTSSIPEQVSKSEQFSDIQSTLVSWLDNQDHNISELNQVSFSTLICFLYGLKEAMVEQLELEFEEDDVSNTNSALQSIAYTYAFKALNSFPDGFYRFLSEFRARRKCSSKYGFVHEFGQIYRIWLLQHWLHTNFQFIHNAFNEYICHEFVPYEQMSQAKWLEYYPNLLDLSDFITLKQVKKYFPNLSVRQILFGISAGKLQFYRAPDEFADFLRISELKREFYSD